jgi:hypothetical protein
MATTVLRKQYSEIEDVLTIVDKSEKTITKQKPTQRKTQNTSQKSETFSVVSLFSGCGGMVLVTSIARIHSKLNGLTN